MPWQNVNLNGHRGQAMGSWWEDLTGKAEQTRRATYEAAKANVTSGAEKIAGKVGGAIAKPVAAETQSQTKAYLPWILLALVGVTAIGGLFGGLGARSRRK